MPKLLPKCQNKQEIVLDDLPIWKGTEIGKQPPAIFFYGLINR